MAILLFREALRTDYRSAVELIDLMDGIKETLQLDQVPHYSTIHTFMTRISSAIFSIFLEHIPKVSSSIPFSNYKSDAIKKRSRGIPRDR